MSGDKQPISVLVVIYTAELKVLLLERADHPGYWQSVTGSREENEPLHTTSIREVYEETGLVANEYVLTDWQLQNSYEIYPHWRHRYPPGVTTNTEHVFGLCVPKVVPVQLAAGEHLAYQWLSCQDAAEKVFSPSNRAAILRLKKKERYA